MKIQYKNPRGKVYIPWMNWLWIIPIWIHVQCMSTFHLGKIFWFASDLTNFFQISDLAAILFLTATFTPWPVPIKLYLSQVAKPLYLFQLSCLLKVLPLVNNWVLSYLFSLASTWQLSNFLSFLILLPFSSSY